MLRILRTAIPLFVLLSLLAAQQPLPTEPLPGEFPSGAPPRRRARDIKRGLSDETGQPAARAVASPSSAGAERYRKLRRDTDELLRLALELKQSVDKINPNTISVETLKNAEQIEKLAKAVKSTLKNR